MSKRRNPHGVLDELEQAERMIATLQKVLAAYRAPFELEGLSGCGDNSCIVKSPRGMATNGGCRCEPRELRRAVMAYRHECQRLRGLFHGSEQLPAPVDALLFPVREITLGDVVGVIHKMREAPVPTLESRSLPQALDEFLGARLVEPQRSVAMGVWRAVLNANPHVVLPTCGIVDDDAGDEQGHVYFGWNPGPHTLDISISPLGEVSWFYADHHTAMHVTSDDNPGDGYLAFLGLFTRTELST